MLVLFSLMTALAAAPGPADPAPARAGAHAGVIIGAVGAPDLDRVVCKREAVLGSRRLKKLCLTRLEWSQREEAARRLMDTTLWGVGGDKPAPAPK